VTLFLVQLRERGGKPWSTPHVVRADDPETAARQAFPEPPSTLNVWDAYVVALAEPYAPVSVLIDVPKPKWGRSRPAMPGAREPQRQVEGDPALYDDRDTDAQVERAMERAL